MAVSDISDKSFKYAEMLGIFAPRSRRLFEFNRIKSVCGFNQQVDFFFVLIAIEIQRGLVDSGIPVRFQYF